MDLPSYMRSVVDRNVVMRLMTVYVNIYKKGKAIPLQAWTGPEGSRSLRLPDFKTIGT